ncbi:helix-turn-helix domain-containing protein [Mycolicibacterium pulveris]|nr:helix-turn-helix domain-containing protein [Mycolicibacterium pulveris]
MPKRPTIKQAADHHGLSEKTIRRYIAEGRLVAYRVGKRSIRVDRESLIRLATPLGGAA